MGIEHITQGLNIDPVLALMAFQAETPEELDEALSEIEREQDMARLADAARAFKERYDYRD